MSVLVLLEATVKPEEVSNFTSYMAELLPVARSYDGCQMLDAYFNTEDGSQLVAVEKWDSRQHHEKYLAWRTETGVMGKLIAMLSGPPSIRYFEKADA